MSDSIQRAFLMKPKTPYFTRIEKALCDLTSPLLTRGVFYCSVFQIEEKFYVRFLESGVWKGIFLAQGRLMHLKGLKHYKSHKAISKPDTYTIALTMYTVMLQ